MKSKNFRRPEIMFLFNPLLATSTLLMKSYFSSPFLTMFSGVGIFVLNVSLYCFLVFHLMV